MPREELQLVQLRVTKPQHKALKKLAKKTKDPASVHMRKALDLYLASLASPTETTHA